MTEQHVSNPPSRYLYYASYDKASDRFMTLAYTAGVILAIAFMFSGVYYSNDFAINLILKVLTSIVIFFCFVFIAIIYKTVHSNKIMEKLLSEGTIYYAKIIAHEYKRTENKYESNPLYQTDNEILEVEINGNKEQLWLPLDKREWHQIDTELCILIYDNYFMLR